jgi:hypothetical protein
MVVPVVTARLIIVIIPKILAKSLAVFGQNEHNQLLPLMQS